jgi:Amt family ammonium transporter
MIDFAGGTVVHMLGGSIGLIGAFISGPRLGRFKTDDDSQPVVDIPGHSSVLVALGTAILWVGWYGFNSGSTLGLSNMKFQTAARISVVTTLSATASACVCLAWMRVMHKKYDLGLLLNCLLGGLASATAGCAVLQPWAAFITGGM